MKPAELSFPDMYRVDQLFPDTGIKDVCGEARRLLEGFDLKQRTQAGQSVAVCVASRGTHDLKDLVTTTVTHLTNSGLKPFISYKISMRNDHLYRDPEYSWDEYIQA